MPTKPRKETKRLIELFISAYENDSWKGAHLDWLDERQDGAVEVLATRSDGKTLAIEHTIIQPFVGDKEDFAFFAPMFLPIENDKSLLVPNLWIRVFVPVGTLHGRKLSVRDAIVRDVHDWLKKNRLSLANGSSEHQCTVGGITGKPNFTLTLTVKVVPLPGAGSLHVRRQQVDNNLGDVVEKALRKKLPKLVKTLADKRILLLERQHMNLLPKSICDEIEKRKSIFPELADVHEIWVTETMFYEKENEDYVGFELYENGCLVQRFDFQDGQLFMRG
jgi:hypothetical protein